jgi:hypothetical protein
MATPTLEPCREKWARGQAILQNLGKRLEAYTTDPPPHKVEVTFEVARGELVFYGEVLKAMEDQLLWGCILGDGMHNLRCALDHLVWQLVLLDSGEEGTDQNQFPICDTGRSYWDTKKGQSMRDRRLQGVNEGHRAVIDEMQPYRTYAPGKAHPLSTLRDLDNIDKHRLIHTTLFVPGIPVDSDFRLEPNADAGEQSGNPVFHPFVEGKRVEIMTVKYTCPGPNPEVRVFGNPTVEVGVAGLRVRLAQLPDIGKLVWEIVESFADDFP